MTLDELMATYGQQILALADRFGVENVRVFGSVARGEADEESDIDLLVSIRPGTTLLDLGGLLWRMEELLSAKVDIVSDRRINRHMKDAILSEAKPI